MMYVLVMWICTAGACEVDIVPGMYQTVEACEAARDGFVEAKSVLFEVGARAAACINAPDYGTFE
jgi:hypothetical protein